MFSELYEEQEYVLHASCCASIGCVHFLRQVRILEKHEQGRVATPYIAKTMSRLEFCLLWIALLYLRRINLTGLYMGVNNKTHGGANPLDIFK